MRGVGFAGRMRGSGGRGASRMRGVARAGHNGKLVGEARVLGGVEQRVDVDARERGLGAQQRAEVAAVDGLPHDLGQAGGADTVAHDGVQALGDDESVGRGEVPRGGISVKLQPVDELGGVRRRPEREPQQLAQRGPLGVPGAVRALVDKHRGGRVQRRREVRRADRGRANEHRLRGVPLLRHRRRAAAGALGELADLGAAQRRDLIRDQRDGVDHLRQRIPKLGQRPALRVPRHRRRQTQRRRELGGQARGDPRIRPLNHRRERAARPAELRGQLGHRIRKLRLGAGDAAPPVRGAQADRRRHRVLR